MQKESVRKCPDNNQEAIGGDRKEGLRIMREKFEQSTAEHLTMLGTLHELDKEYKNLSQKSDRSEAEEGRLQELKADIARKEEEAAKKNAECEFLFLQISKQEYRDLSQKPEADQTSEDLRRLDELSGLIEHSERDLGIDQYRRETWGDKKTWRKDL